MGVKKYAFILCLLLNACQSKPEVGDPKSESGTTIEFDQLQPASPETTVKTKPVVRYRNTSEIVNDTNTVVWRSANYYPNLDFVYEKGKIVIEFDGQCSYTYPVLVREQSITVLYAVRENCTHDIGIKKTFGLKNHPQEGKPFFELTLINDSTLEASYLYPEWTAKVNQLNANYPCFVKRFYAKIY